jgi:magnesium-transporting ATPase (P-type)
MGAVQVLPGARIPTDGTVVHGESYVDEAMLTGESSPVRKVEGAEVVGGTVNVGGPLIIRAARCAPAAPWRALVPFDLNAQVLLHCLAGCFVHRFI